MNQLQILLRISVLSVVMGSYAHFAIAQTLVSLQQPPDDFMAMKSDPEMDMSRMELPGMDMQNTTLKSVLEELQAK